MTTLLLNVPGSTISSARYGDAIAHCSAALEGCWELYRASSAGDTLLAFQCVSKYLPILTTIANESSLYRNSALDLAARYALLKIRVGWNCVGVTEIISYTNYAVVLCDATGNISLRLSAYREQAWAYFRGEKYELARKATRKGEVILKEYQNAKSGPPLPSSMIGSFYSSYALVQTGNGENPDWALGIATDSEPSDEPIAFMVFSPPAQLLEAAFTTCFNGEAAKAIKWIEKRIDTTTLMPLVSQTERGRLHAVNILTNAMLKSPDRDTQTIFDHFKAGIEGARKLQSEQRFKEAVANFRALEVAFPWEKKALAELRPLTVHWNTTKQLPGG